MRLKDKTQVFLSPQGDHYRTRLTHTLIVSQTARTIAKALSLNEDLVEAIALGHDLGHTPFGHAGEVVLNNMSEEGFTHFEQSVRVVEILERDGNGLNLSWEVIDGILNHQMSTLPATLEGQVVRLCDKISYMHHDMEDAERAGIISEDDIPITIRMVLGASTKERLDTFMHDIVTNSFGQDHIMMSEDVANAMEELREIMFAQVYRNPIAKSEEVKAKRMLGELYKYYIDNPGLMTSEYQELIQSGEKVDRVVCDYISGMTDQYSINKFEEIFVPLGWSGE
jgi:dGTP triphosphohydrolase